jgi:hypothetical protein
MDIRPRRRSLVRCRADTVGELGGHHPLTELTECGSFQMTEALSMGHALVQCRRHQVCHCAGAVLGGASR